MEPPASSVAPVTSGPGIVITPLPDCRAASLRTATPGRLTFTTTSPPSAPWFDGHPADGRGFEAAVASAVSRELGYAGSDVSWTTSDLGKVITGHGSGFDVALGEFAIPADGTTVVDYSTGYFSISSSVVARAGSAAARVTSLSGLRKVRVGAIGGTRQAQVAEVQIGTPVAFASSSAALAALRAGQVDQVVLPTPEAITAGPGFAVVGQLPGGSEQPQQFGMVLPKGSPLTACVSAAIDEIRVDGTLAALLETWVPAAARPLN